VATYNGRHLLETMLPSVSAQSFTDFRTVIVDDASTDDTVAWLGAHWADVEVVALAENGGVTNAFNVCLDAAGDAEYVALFNNDIELDPECLGELVQALDAHPEAGSAGAKLVDFHRRSHLDGAGDTFDWAGTGWRRGNGEPDDGRYSDPEAVFGACGGAAVYRRAALEQVGPFDASFYAFFEDTDWAFRAQLAGWTCRYVPSAVAFHMGSATLGKGLTDFTRRQLVRNRIWLVAKDYPLPTLLRHAPRIAYVTLAECALSIRAGQFGVWASAWLAALRGLPSVLRRRRAVQATRRVSIGELERAAQLGR
jgi:GT2 family glycosyltransferase